MVFLDFGGFLAIDDSFIFDTFKYCQEVFSKHGINLQFPKNTDPKTTYKWRFLAKFCNKVGDLGFSMPAVKAMVEAAVESNKKVLKQKGLSILLDSKVVNLGMKKLNSAEDNTKSIIDSIKKSKKFVDLNKNAVVRKDVSNYIIWYIQNNISLYYFVVSRSCINSLQTVSSRFKQFTPTKLQLFETRKLIMDNSSLKYTIKNIMGEDWAG